MTNRCLSVTKAAIVLTGENYPPESVWGSRHKWTQSYKRIVATAFRRLGLSLNEIAREVGYVDHTSIMHLLDKTSDEERKVADLVFAKIQAQSSFDSMALVKPTEVLACVASAAIGVIPAPTRASSREIKFRGAALSGQVRLIAVQDSRTGEWRWEPE